MRKFRNDFGVYTCPHVFKKQRPVNLIIRDPDGDWQFSCGNEEADDASDCHLIGVGHLLEIDSSLGIMADLEPNHGAQRNQANDDWEFFELDTED